MVNNTITPRASAPATSPTTGLSADQLFTAAFSVPRDPRSTAYKNGVHAALQFRIEDRRIPKLYEPGTAEDDAYYAGITEGHAIWRRAQAESAGAA